MTVGMINANPVVHERPERAAHPAHAALDALDVFDTVRDIKDPEHPYSLEQLSVLSQESVSVDEKLGHIQITFTPTVQHCSMATVIGLCLRLKLMQNFPPHYKIDIKVAPGSLANEESAERQGESRGGLGEPQPPAVGGRLPLRRSSILILARP
ncbi:hypothetical protein ACQJBY_045976 [Aegilops geniculata]